MKDAAKEQQAEIRSLKSEVKDYREMLDSAQAKISGLKESANNSETMRQVFYDGFISEREDLLGRLHRIDARIIALGFLPPDDRFSSTAVCLKSKGQR